MRYQVLQASMVELKEAYEHALVHQLHAEQNLDLELAYHFKDEADFWKTELSQRVVMLVDAIRAGATASGTDSGEQSGS